MKVLNRQFFKHKYRVVTLSLMEQDDKGQPLETSTVEVTGSVVAYRIQRRLEATQKEVVVYNMTLGTEEYRTEVPEYA